MHNIVLSLQVYNQLIMLNQNEQQRYKRQLTIPEFKEEAQLRLKNAKVLVVGAGGLGCPALQYLVAAGIGTLGIVDGDVVDITNLHRQVLFGDTDIGKNKAETAFKKLEKLNPNTVFEIVTQHFTQENAKELANKYDVLLDCTDNFPTRFLINDIGFQLGKPVVFCVYFSF